MATDPHHIDPTAYLEELLTQASPDLMRQMLTDFINQILSAQADSVCGADYATVSPQRTNTRNGYRHRRLDTRVGSLDIAIPKLRSGAFFPEWLLERRTRTCRFGVVGTASLRSWYRCSAYPVLQGVFFHS